MGEDDDGEGMVATPDEDGGFIPMPVQHSEMLSHGSPIDLPHPSTVQQVMIVKLYD